ncbi:CWF19-like protein 2 homolog [Lucilia sericata]|uniref:CWF19-like protein 2 homolog n=1 Tax=Lucilia sericata TaxID=13632 RepID=UPI0018A82F0A|nr:CWF19-like protein 2 homolog [Lucilia sericata]
MSFIQFESARAKDKARQDLREARENMLDEAKKRAVQRAERETERLLKGESNWMLPSVEKKLKKRSKEVKKSKKKKDKKSKKSKKKSNRKRKHSSTDDESDSSDSDSTSDDDSTSSSSDEQKKRKKSKKSKKKHKKSSKSKRTTSSSSDTDSENTDNEKSEFIEIKKSEEPLQRDSWMTDSLMLKTYSRERVENKPNDKQQIDAYDPAKSTRELNPYWKTTGTGLPAFQKPKDDDNYTNKKSVFSQSNCYSSKGWKKQRDKPLPNECLALQRKKSPSSSDDSSSTNDEEPKGEPNKEISSTNSSEFLTDQQMNELGAKILKAEIMGNMSLADELREKLEKARTQRNIFKERQKSAYLEGKHSSTKEEKSGKKDEHILLTHTDHKGQSRPLPASKVLDPRDLYGGRKKQKQKRVNTHDESGERVRYFADDDRYDIKQMFEREKYTSASDANLQFANIAGKHKNPNDDMEDIFAEKICQDDSSRSDRKDRDRAIREHQKVEAALDNCDKCFDSTKMQKELLVCVGENVYLALPWYQGLQPGHCMIITNQHATCCTQIDEDTWAEINDFRKALTRMFASQHKDVIFFEIANRLHRRPHLVIHCIPIRESDGEMAPFYFKKAIEESEHEWCVNKQLVSLRQKSLRSSIPKGLPYFWVNFGMDTGFAHVIEDEERFPPNFAQEIIGGMLNLDANKWRRLQKEQNIITKVKMFADWWKKYDCTT